MAYLALEERGTNFLRVYGTGLGARIDNNTFMYCSNGQYYKLSNDGGYAGNYHTTTQTFTGLSPDTSYGFYIQGKTEGGTAVRIPSSGYEYFTTEEVLKPSAPTIYANASDGLRVSWTIYYDSGVTRLFIDRDFGSEISVNVSSSSTSYTYTFTASSYNTSLSIRAQAYNSEAGVGNYSSWCYTQTGSPPTPSRPSITGSVNGKSISLTLSKGANTSYIEFENYHGGISYYYNSTNSVSFTVPDFNTSYTVYARGWSGDLSSTWTSYQFRSGSDTTAPTITITNATGNNQILLDWTASDNDGLRATNPFVIYIGSGGGNFDSLSLKGYTSGSSYTISTDRNGAPLSPNVTYPIRVGAYDKSGNYGYADRYVRVTRSRPSNYSWSASKVSGGDFNLSANEWNDLLERINAFRYYKGLAHATFTTAQRGQSLTATQFNEAANIIDTLSPTTSVPARVATGQDIQAAQLNRLRDSLNSVA